jgi:hypothetical protein
MNVVACVLTRNQYEHHRRFLFEQTIASLHAAGLRPFVLDNNSSDGTDRFVDAGGDDWIPAHAAPSSNTTSGYGTWECMRLLAGTDADVCVVSDDDMVWRPNMVDTLTEWWKHRPYRVKLTGGHIEPEFPWNETFGSTSSGQVRGLLRASTGSASWTFPRADFPILAACAQKLPIDVQGHWDVPMCRALRDMDYQVAQIDIAEHAGQGQSTWGNGAEERFGWDVDSMRARL